MGLFSLGDTLSSSNQDSPIGKLGKPIQQWTDPLSWITGGKWSDWTSTDLPRAVNQVFSPITQFAGSIDKKVNPVRQIPIVDKIGDTAEAKPGDAVGLAIGSYFTGGALGGALAGSGSGAGAGAAAGAGAGAADASAAGAAAGSGTAGASGLTGIFSGPAAYGDAGLTGTTTASGSGLSGALGGDLSGSLGSSPTGLFSGLLPGGGMTSTSSGALGGGLSGSVAGSSSLGGATMGGVDTGLYQQLLSKALNQASNSYQQTANAQQNNMAQLPAARQGTPTNALASAALDQAQAQRIAAARQSNAARAVTYNPYLQYGK
ncbi:hypothetical protein WM40_22700 [Robbsia andropogonis]|uniref:Uncharacterized protein n=1 Tax=Robbsia andropogonis TaxID=28092 RepID=A0A0F5JWB4_9BURK|nr:hypothetical protein [Robbsia andropogonis]KKB61552.1 hypothetical protein WM40_22700 [Robbsia andropogonis]